MTVAEMIDTLSKMPKGATVYFQGEAPLMHEIEEVELISAMGGSAEAVILTIGED